MSVEVLQLSKDGEPTKPNRSVRELARHLGVSFVASDLQLSTIALARKVESLEFEVRLLRHELRGRRWWTRLLKRGEK